VVIDVNGRMVLKSAAHAIYLSAWDDGTAKLMHHVKEWRH
jgi:hypothetical protein